MTFSLPHPDVDPDYWDRCAINDVRIPGKVVVKVAKERSVDKRKAVGEDGATLTDKGYMPADVQISVKLANQQHMDDMAKVLEIIDPERNGLRQPQRISSPQTDAQRIPNIYVFRIEGPDVEAKNIVSYVLKADQWFPDTTKLKHAKMPTPEERTTFLDTLGEPDPYDALNSDQALEQAERQFQQSGA